MRLRKYLGYLWMVLSPILVLLMIYQAYFKISNTAEGLVRTNTTLQWVIILIIFIPICIGFFLFGKYSAQGLYDNENKESE